jgi:hypothetical protein
MKLITSAIALVGLLAACNLGATTPSEQSLPTLGSSTGTIPSPSASVAGSCTDAFAAIDLSAISSTTDLMSLSDELDATISSCPTLEEWTASVQTGLPQVDTTQAQAFLQQRCTDNAMLASTQLCLEVAS